MRDDDILPDELGKVLYIVPRELAVMRDHFQGQIYRGYACLALAKPGMGIDDKLFVELTEHTLHLFIQHRQIGHIPELVKKYRVPFDLRDLEPNVIGVDQRLQQLLDDQPAVFDICLVDKFCKATYIRNKKQPPVAHFFF